MCGSFVSSALRKSHQSPVARCGFMALLWHVCILPPLLIFHHHFSPRVIHMADERLSAACFWNQHPVRRMEMNARSQRGYM